MWTVDYALREDITCSGNDRWRIQHAEWCSVSTGKELLECTCHCAAWTNESCAMLQEKS